MGIGDPDNDEELSCITNWWSRTSQISLLVCEIPLMKRDWGVSRVPLPGSPKGPSLYLSRYADHPEIVMMTLHIPQEKVADRYSTDELVAIETSKRLYRAASVSYVCFFVSGGRSGLCLCFKILAYEPSQKLSLWYQLLGPQQKYPWYFRLIISLGFQRWRVDEGSPREATLEISMEGPRGTLTGFCRRRLSRHMEPLSRPPWNAFKSTR